MTRAQPPSLGHLQLKTINYTRSSSPFPPTVPFSLFFFFNSAILPIYCSSPSFSFSLSPLLSHAEERGTKSKESDVRKKTRIARLGPGMSKILEILSSGSGSAVHALHGNFMNPGILFQPRESAIFSCATPRFHERMSSAVISRRNCIYEIGKLFVSEDFRLDYLSVRFNHYNHTFNGFVYIIVLIMG